MKNGNLADFSSPSLMLTWLPLVSSLNIIMNRNTYNFLVHFDMGCPIKLMGWQRKKVKLLIQWHTLWFFSLKIWILFDRRKSNVCTTKTNLIVVWYSHMGSLPGLPRQASHLNCAAQKKRKSRSISPLSPKLTQRFFFYSSTTLQNQWMIYDTKYIYVSLA